MTPLEMSTSCHVNDIDIDIVVESLDEDYFQTLLELEAILDKDVDLIEIEEYPFKEEIEKRGMRIKCEPVHNFPKLPYFPCDDLIRDLQYIY